MHALKWMISLFCLLYPARVEGVWQHQLTVKKQAPESRKDGTFSKGMMHVDQMTCDTTQALTNGHVA